MKCSVVMFLSLLSPGGQAVAVGAQRVPRYECDSATHLRQALESLQP